MGLLDVFEWAENQLTGGEKHEYDIDIAGGDDPVAAIIDGAIQTFEDVGGWVAGGVEDIMSDLNINQDHPENLFLLVAAIAAGMYYVGTSAAGEIIMADAAGAEAAAASGAGTGGVGAISAAEAAGTTATAGEVAAMEGVAAEAGMSTAEYVSYIGESVTAESVAGAASDTALLEGIQAGGAGESVTNWLGWAAVGSTAVGTALTVGAMETAAEATAEAAAASTAATEAGITATEEAYAQWREDTATARAAGEAAITGMEGMEKFEGSEATRFTPGTFTGETEFTGGPGKFDYKPYEALTIEELKADPSYDFRFGEGAKAVQASQIGRNLSGRAAKELTRFGSDFASQEYGRADERKYRNWVNDTKIRYGIHSDEYRNAVTEFESQFQKEYGIFTDVENRRWDLSNETYNREAGEYGTEMNRLSTLAGYGNTANTVLGGAGMTGAGNIGQYGVWNAQNQGNLQLGNAAIQNQGWNNIWGNINTGLENWITWDQYNQ